MSYTIRLNGSVCPTCGHPGPAPSDCPNPTYNLTEIFDLALTGEPLPNPEVNEMAVVLFGKRTDRPRGLRLLDGRAAGETLADLNRALDRLADDRMRPAFVALEPENKWGDLPGAIRVLQLLKGLAEEYPANVWEIT